MDELRDAPVQCRMAVNELRRNHGRSAIARRVEDGYSVVVARRRNFLRYHVSLTGQTTLIESWPRTLRQRLRAYLRWLGFAMIYGSFAALWVFYGGSCSSEEGDFGWGGLLVFALFVGGLVVVWHSEPLHGAIHEGEVTEGDDWFEVTGDGDGGNGGGNGGNGGGGGD